MSTPAALSGGAFQDAQGNVLVNGYLTFELNQDEQVSGSGQLSAGVIVKITLDSSGNVTAGQSIWGNDVMTPGNSYYIVKGYTAAGQLAWGPNSQQVTGASFNLSTWVPNTVTNWNPTLQLLALQTNEVANGSQALLDLHAGANVTLTDNGSGRVTIATNSSTANAQWMLSAGIFGMPIVTGGSSNFIDLAFRVGFCRFATPFNLSAFTHVDATMRTALGGGSNIGFAIYDDNKNLVWQSGAFNLTNSANQKLVSFSSPALTLAPGAYYLAWSSDTVNVSVWGLDLTPLVFLSGSSDANIINQGTIPTFGYAANPATNASALSFPSTLGALTAYAGGVNNFVLPYVFFRP